MFLQNMTEFWNTATRPASARGGYGMALIEADQKARLLERFIVPFLDPMGLYEEWRRLVVQFGVSGVQVYDARLVASCLASGMTRIVTFNGKDFQRYASEGIVVVDPATI